jgi:hypothetical protein
MRILYIVKKRKLGKLPLNGILNKYSINLALQIRKFSNCVLNLIVPLTDKEIDSEGIQFWLICDNYCYYMWNRGRL